MGKNVKGKKINQNTLVCVKVGRLQVEEKKGVKESGGTEMNWRVVG